MGKQDCRHSKISYTVTTRRVGGVHVAHVQARCDHCDRPFVFRGVESGFDVDGPRTNATGQELRLPMEPAPSGVSVCPECRIRLFGAPVGDAPPLSRPVPVQQIQCGPVHRVHFTDGVVLLVAEGRVRSETKPCEGHTASA